MTLEKASFKYKGPTAAAYEAPFRGKQKHRNIVEVSYTMPLCKAILRLSTSPKPPVEKRRAACHPNLGS